MLAHSQPAHALLLQLHVHFFNLHWKTSLSLEALQASACLMSYAPEEPVNLHIADDLLRTTPAFHRA